MPKVPRRKTPHRRRRDFERAGDHPDIWTAGRQADDNAGDEGIDADAPPVEQEPLSAAIPHKREGRG